MSEKAVPPAFNPAITEKDVLITGGAGSIGSELARQVCQLAPRSLTLLDINENALYLSLIHIFILVQETAVN